MERQLFIENQCKWHDDTWFRRQPREWSVWRGANEASEASEMLEHWTCTAGTVQQRWWHQPWSTWKESGLRNTSSKMSGQARHLFFPCASSANDTNGANSPKWSSGAIEASEVIVFASVAFGLNNPIRAPSIILPGLTHACYLTDTLSTDALSLSLCPSVSQSLTHTRTHANTLSPHKHLINVCNHPPKSTTCYLMHSTHLILERCKFIHTLNQKPLSFMSSFTLYVRYINAFHFSVYMHNNKCKCSLYSNTTTQYQWQ